MKTTVFKFLLDRENKKYIEIANLIGVTRQMAQSWASGSRPIAKEYIPRIAEYLGVPEWYLHKGLSDKEKLQIQKEMLIKECERLGVNFEEL